MIYLDNASTSWPKPSAVLDGINNYFHNIGASPSRGAYSLATKGEQIINETRSQLSKFFNIRNTYGICFTSNATHSLNIALKGILHSKDHVLISNFEHNSVLRPLEKLKRNINIKYDVFYCDKDGMFDLDNLEKKITKNTKLIICNHASNVIGVISPISAIGKIARKYKIPFLVDCTQTAGLLSIDVERDHIDILAGTAHKSLLGPSGVGFLYINDSINIDTFCEGGSGHNSISPNHPETMPIKFEAGTLNYLGIAGFNRSLEYLKKTTIKKIFNHEMCLMEYLLEQLIKINGITVYGTQNIDNKIPLVSFNLKNLFPSEVGYLLDKNYSIYVRSGLQCAPLVHQSLNTLPNGTVRASLGYKNTIEDINSFLEAIGDLSKKFSC